MKKKIWEYTLLAVMTMSIGFMVACGGGKKIATTPTSPVPQPPIVDPGGHHNLTEGATWGDESEISNPDLYRDFIEGWPATLPVPGPVCNPNNIWNWGSISCKRYDSNSFMYITITGDHPPYAGTVTIWATNDLSYGDSTQFGIPLQSAIIIEGEFVLAEGDSKLVLQRPGVFGSYSHNDAIKVTIHTTDLSLEDIGVTVEYSIDSASNFQVMTQTIVRFVDHVGGPPPIY